MASAHHSSTHGLLNLMLQATLADFALAINADRGARLCEGQQMAEGDAGVLPCWRSAPIR